MSCITKFTITPNHHLRYHQVMSSSPIVLGFILMTVPLYHTNSKPTWKRCFISPTRSSGFSIMSDNWMPPSLEGSGSSMTPIRSKRFFFSWTVSFSSALSKLSLATFSFRDTISSRSFFLLVEQSLLKSFTLFQYAARWLTWSNFAFNFFNWDSDVTSLFFIFNYYSLLLALYTVTLLLNNCFSAF